MRLRPAEDEWSFIRRLLYVILAVALCYFLYKVADLILLAFGAIIGGVLLSAMADMIADKTGWRRSIALAIATAILFALLGLMGWLFGSQTSQQISHLNQTLPGQWAKVRASLMSHPAGQMLVASLDHGARGSGLARRLFKAGWGASEILVNFIIILIGGIFFAAQPRLYRRGLVLLAPPAYRDVAHDALSDVARTLRLWLLTQLISMALMGVMISFGLWWSGIEAWAALGLLGGLSEFIPYVGPTLAMIPPVIIALAGDGSVWGVLGTYAIVRVVQANIITPLISQRVVSVPPALYLFLILACGYAFGTFGLFFSGALAVTAYTLAIRLYSREILGDPVELPGEDQPPAPAPRGSSC